MKHTLWLFVVAILVSIPARAQEPLKPASGTISLSMKGIPRQTVLEVIAKESNLGISFDDPVPGNWSGDLTNVTIGTAIRSILPEGYEGRVDENFVIHIRKTRTLPSAEVSRPTTPPQIVEYPPESVPQAGGCAGYSDTDPRARPDSPDPWLRNEWWRTVGYPCQRQQRAAAWLSAPIPTLGYAGYGAGYRSGYYDQYYGFIQPWKGCMTGPAGYIKFKYLGGREERHLWYVRINGELIGTLDQGDSTWNNIPICAAPTRVKIEKRGGGSWEDQYSVRPGTLTEIGVGDFLLEARTAKP